MLCTDVLAIAETSSLLGLIIAILVIIVRLIVYVVTFISDHPRFAHTDLKNRFTFSLALDKSNNRLLMSVLTLTLQLNGNKYPDLRVPLYFWMIAKGSLANQTGVFLESVS